MPGKDEVGKEETLINDKNKGLREITHVISNIKTDKRYERGKINEES